MRPSHSHRSHAVCVDGVTTVESERERCLQTQAGVQRMKNVQRDEHDDCCADCSVCVIARLHEMQDVREHVMQDVDCDEWVCKVVKDVMIVVCVVGVSGIVIHESIDAASVEHTQCANDNNVERAANVDCPCSSGMYVMCTLVDCVDVDGLRSLNAGVASEVKLSVVIHTI